MPVERQCEYLECQINDDDPYSRDMEFIKCVSNGEQSNTSPDIGDCETIRDDPRGFTFVLCERCFDSETFFRGPLWDTDNDECDFCDRHTIHGKCIKLDGKRMCKVCFRKITKFPRMVNKDVVDWFLEKDAEERKATEPPDFTTLRTALDEYNEFNRKMKEAESNRRGVALKNIERKKIQYASVVVNALGVDRCIGKLTLLEIVNELALKGRFEND